MEVAGHIQVPAVLPRGNSPLYPLNRKIDSYTGHLRVEKNLLALPGIEPRFLYHPIHNLVYKLTEITGSFQAGKI
jgi:hypothetical protein